MKGMYGIEYFDIAPLERNFYCLLVIGHCPMLEM